MASESERIEEVRKYIEATIAEIDRHTEDLEKCTMQHVESVVTNATFHSSQDKTSQSIAASVFKVIKETRK